MPGKAYTLKEMKLIVEYLTKNKAYGEIRGRKLWMDLANAKVLDRTWQSLKETFLKRILPDIHNPYYKLTVEQIASFRQESDVNGQNKNKLDIVTISEDSNDCQKVADPVQSKTENKTTGEKKSSKTDVRSSTETVVLENCYETAEDVQRVLESPAQSNGRATKSLRDFITYSEPLTPLLQDVLHDFDSDDDEPQLQIVEPEHIKTEEDNKKESPSPDPVLESETKTGNGNITAENAIEKSKIKSLKLKKTQKGTWEYKETQEVKSSKPNVDGNEQESEIVFPDDTTPLEAQNKDKNNVTSEKNTSIDKIENTNDTAIPNNQEELAKEPNEKRKSTESNCSEVSATHKKHKKVKSRKRSHSQNSTDRKKKRKRSPETSAPREQEMDTQTFNSHPQATSLLKKIDETINTKEDTVVNNSETKTSVLTDARKSNAGTSQEAGPSGVNVTANADANPCLKSVSLFEEQFSTSKYSSSENEDGAEDKETKEPEEKTSDPKENLSQTTTDVNLSTVNSTEEGPVVDKSAIDKMILLKSHSESESDDIEVPKKRTARPAGRIRTLSLKRSRQRDTSRRYSQRQRKKSRNLSLSVESGSSDEYTTASDSEGSSPRGFRNLYRRYGKPQSYDILSHPDGGGLFVVGRKKIYPLFMRENGKLHYTLAGEDASDDKKEYYWKDKYIEEKKKLAEEKIRADELARLLKEAKEVNLRRATPSPIIQSIPSTPSRQIKEQSTIEKGHTDTNKEEKEQKTDEVVKIKFTKNKEIELEGQWPFVNPFLEKMVAILNNNAMPSEKSEKSEITNNENKPNTVQKEPEIVQNEATNKTHNDVKSPNKSTENNANTSTISNDTDNSKAATDDKGNAKTKPTQKKVAKKKADAPKSAGSIIIVSSGVSTPVGVDPEVHEKVNQLESEIFKQIEEIDKSESALEVPNDTNINTRRRGRPKKTSSSLSISSLEGPSKQAASPKKSPNKAKKDTDSESVPKTMPKRPTRAPRKYESDSGVTVSKLRKSSSNLSLNLSGQKNVIIPEDDPNVRYMFPPSVPNRTLDRNVKKSSRSYNPQTIFTSPENLSRFSESTQGYQDSDVSPPNLNRKKKKIGSSGLHRVKRRASPYLADEDTNETNDSTNFKTQAQEKENSTIYRSESYQLLLPKPINVYQFDRIDESLSQSTKGFEVLVNNNNEFYIPTLDMKHNLSKKNSEGNSSSVSLPLSPELSVVENLSVSKDTINNSLQDHPTLNELHANVGLEQAAEPDNYMIDDIDVSVPLMEQDFALHTYQSGVKTGGKNTVSESLINNIHSVGIQEPSLSDSLNLKLRDMLLESAKKISQQANRPEEVIQMEVDDLALNKKVRGNKRCSTPRKRKVIAKSKTPDITPVLEEHIESCSFGGRQSCPPVISVIPSEEVPADDHEFELSNEIDNVAIIRGKRKKDIIKVKILRPRSKSSSLVTANESTLSVHFDSGINDTSAISCPSRSDSTELIHNHSDTCLQMDGCISDSVEFIDNGTQSIISLSSTSINFDKRESDVKESSGEFNTPEMFCTNAQDATSLVDVASARTSTQTLESTGGTQYHTPPNSGSFNSLLTEDMSDSNERPPSASKWYLVNEQETNFVGACSQSSNTGGVGSNLKQIFPIACAVPNLSTITEISKENDSAKPTSTTDVQQTDFQSIFNP